RTQRAGLVFELWVDELGHHVVGRVVDAPVDVFGELLTRDGLHRIVPRLARLGSNVLVGPVAVRLLCGFGASDALSHHPHRGPSAWRRSLAARAALGARAAAYDRKDSSPSTLRGLGVTEGQSPSGGAV